MRKIIIFTVFVLFFTTGADFVYAHEVQGAVLPNPGLIPGNPFYFLDRIGESVREFFTFNQENKARLQLEFALERIAEMKIILETKGVSAPGLGVAQASLQASIEKASNIVDSEQNRGKDVKKLAGEINDELVLQKEALNEVFHDQKDVLKAKEDELKDQIKVANDSDNQELADSLEAQALQINEEKNNLDLKNNELEEEFENKSDNLERKLDLEAQAGKAIKEAEEKLNGLAEEIQERENENQLDIPSDTFAKFNNLLNQAKDLYAKGNFQAAKELAENAEKSLKEIKKAIEEFGEAGEADGLPEIRESGNDNTGGENNAHGEKSKKENQAERSCINDSECNEGFSCWNKPPAGPMKGISGSKETPGTCFNKDLLERIF